MVTIFFYRYCISILINYNKLWLDLNVFSAQQAFETLKLTFGDNRCFLVQINSQQTPSSNDIIDPWLKFLRRQPKMVMVC